MIQRENIQFRVGSSGKSAKGSWAMALVYIDARTCQEELDDRFGVDGWEFSWDCVYGHDFAIKGILKCKMGEEWVTREDVGYPQELKMSKGVNDSEALKDAVSDALKRCAVQFGIGRFLYDAPKLFSYKVKTNQAGKVTGFDEDGILELEQKIDSWYSTIRKDSNEK